MRRGCTVAMMLLAWYGGKISTAKEQAETHAPKEYFVSPSGCETNGGTAADPFRSVAAALARSSGGDLITLMPGTYVEAIVVEVSGTPEFPTTIRSQHKWEAIIKATSSHGLYVADGVTNVVI